MAAGVREEHVRVGHRLPEEGQGALDAERVVGLGLTGHVVEDRFPEVGVPVGVGGDRLVVLLDRPETG